jgi:16S rRNA (adenine1518-N6/adenine1519-N6)-dimethyltransferase
MTDLPYAKKSLGQHWLSDTETLQAMVQAAEVGPDDTVLEIGPGAGTLTRHIAEAAGQVIAVEFDHALAAELRRDYSVHSGQPGTVRIEEADILRFDLTTLPAGYKIAANIPYYLTSNLLRVLCESTNPFSMTALLVQKEVAERVAAKPGHMSLLSVSVQFYCEVSLGRVVPARLFVPPPKVDSQILILKYRTEPLLPGVDARVFFRLVKAGFATRRKTLENSLSAGLRLSKTEARELLDRAGLDPLTRAQNLGLTEWHQLYEEYTQAAPANH